MTGRRGGVRGGREGRKEVERERERVRVREGRVGKRKGIDMLMLDNIEIASNVYETSPSGIAIYMHICRPIYILYIYDM